MSMACVPLSKKDSPTKLKPLAPDVLSLQETKAQDDQVREALFGWDTYEVFSSSAEKRDTQGLPS